MKIKIILTIFFASTGGMIYGYDFGIINSALLFINHDIPMTRSQISLLGGSVFFGSAFAILLAGFVADFLGFVGLLLLAGMLYVFLPLEFNGGASNFPLIQSFGVFLAAYLLVIFISRDVLVLNHYWTGKRKPKISQLLEVGFLILPLAMPYVLKLMDLKRRNKLKMDYLNYLKNS